MRRSKKQRVKERKGKEGERIVERRKVQATRDGNNVTQKVQPVIPRVLCQGSRCNTSIALPHSCTPLFVYPLRMCMRMRVCVVYREGT